MSIIDWTGDYLIGIQQIDMHHRHLFSLLNKTYENFIKFASADELNRLFNELVDYAIYHLSEEEVLMQEKRFPGYSMHKEEHDMFVRKVVEMRKEYLDGKRSLSMEILVYMEDWLSTHIPMSDVAMGLFLAAETTSESHDIGRKETLA